MRGTSLQASTSYGPYGSIHQQTGTSQTSYGYTGEQFHAGTGLLYLRARYYSPALHAFTARDPWVGDGMRPVTLNGYNYANANPVFYVDPTGEAAGPIVWCFGVAIAIPDPGLAESACALFAVGAIGVTLVVAGPDAAQQIIDDVVDLAETCINAFRRTIPQPKAIEHSVPRFGPKPIPQPQPEPQPERKVDFLPIPQDIPDNPNLIRVRHYSQAIGQIKTAQEIRSGMSGPLVFIEHPITTSRDAASIQQTTQSFFRPLNGTGGFVEFNVDLNKWVVAQDPNLPWVPNAKVIHPITHQGTIYMKGATMYFPLNEPIVMPTFYNWKGEKMP